MALCSSLTLLVRERDTALLRSVMVGGAWNGADEGMVLDGRVREL